MQNCKYLRVVAPLLKEHVWAEQTSFINALLKADLSSLGFDMRNVQNLYSSLWSKDSEDEIYQRIAEMEEADRENKENQDATPEDYLEWAFEEWHQNNEPRVIEEWWLVSDWLAAELNKRGKPILITDFGHWWGRTFPIEPIYMDTVINEIASA